MWADSGGMDVNIRKAEGFYGRALKPASHLIPFLIPSRLHLDQGSVANRPPDPHSLPTATASLCDPTYRAREEADLAQLSAFLSFFFMITILCWRLSSSK